MANNQTSPQKVPIAQFGAHWWAVSSVCFALLAPIVYAVMLFSKGLGITLIPAIIIVSFCIGLIGKIQLSILKHYVDIQGSWVKPIIIASIIGLVIASVLVRNTTIFQTGIILREAGIYPGLITSSERLALNRAVTNIIRGQQIWLALMGAISIAQWLFLRKHLKRVVWLFPFTVFGCLLGTYLGGLDGGEISLTMLLVIPASQAGQATALAIAFYQERSSLYARVMDIGLLAVIGMLAIAIVPASWMFKPIGPQALEKGWPVEVEQVRHSPVSSCVTQAGGDQPQGFNLMVAEEGIPLRLLVNAVRPGHTDRIEGMAMHPNGRYLITSSPYMIKFWDIYCGEEVLTIGFDSTFEKGMPSGPIAITPDGRKLVSGGLFSGRNGVKVWDVITEEALLFLENEREDARAITAVSISADGNRIVAGSGEVFFVWDTETGEKLLEVANHTDRIYDVAITPDRNWAVSFGYGGDVSVWDLNQYQLHATFTGVDNPSIITGRISPDGQKLVMGDRTGNLRVWGLFTGEEWYSVDTTERGWLDDLAFTQDGKYVVTVGDSQTRVWELETGDEVVSFDDFLAQMVRITPDDRYILTISYSGELNVWDMPENE